MRKLKHSEIKSTREDYIIKQRGTCALCEEIIDSPVLDHSHTTGHIRGVLCRGCNCILSKVENNLAINKITPSKLHMILMNMEEYMITESELIHPTFKDKTKKK